jgi:putative membrane protein
LLVNAVSVYFTAYLLEGVVIDGFLVSIGVALLLAIVNTFLRPILIILTIPITVVTFGLFLFVLNIFMIELVDWLVDGFYIKNFIWAVAFAVIMFFINLVLNSILGLDKGNKN